MFCFDDCRRNNETDRIGIVDGEVEVAGREAAEVARRLDSGVWDL